MVELGRVWCPVRRKYIRIVEGGVPSLWHGYYDRDRMVIHLPKRRKCQSADRYMDICIHEALHATFPSLSEEAVTQRTPILKRLLKKMGVQPVDLG